MVAILMGTGMLLSHFINDAATAVIFAPVGLGIAHDIGIRSQSAAACRS